MPSYILPLGTTPLDHLKDEDIAAGVSKFTDPKKIRDGYKFSIEEKWRLGEIMKLFSNDSDGKPIALQTALSMIAKFSGSPASFNVTKSVLDDFKLQLKSLKDNHLPSGNDMGLRFYVGKADNSDYGMVIVPMYGPTPLAEDPRNRLLEKEKSFFVSSGVPFFALVPSVNAISDSAKSCAELIKNKDTSTIQAIYFSEKSFTSFIDGLTNPDFSQMQFSLARTLDLAGFLTLIIMFFDGSGNPISSSGIFMGRAANGICFDQGDLIPPPSSVPDSSF